VEFTKKSRTEALRMANAIKAKNPKLKPYEVLRIVESKIGKLYYSSKNGDTFGSVVPEGQGEYFYLKSTGRGTLNARPRSEKKNRRGRTESTRRLNINVSTPENVDTPAAKKKADSIRAQGLEVDHFNEVSRTGPALAAMTPEERERYQSRIPSGNQANNYQGLSAEDNGRKNRDLRRLDRYLAKKEATNPSPTLTRLLVAFKAENDNQAARETAQRNGQSPPPRVFFPGGGFDSESGSPIVDRVNGSMKENGYAATLGIPLELF